MLFVLSLEMGFENPLLVFGGDRFHVQSECAKVPIMHVSPATLAQLSHTAGSQNWNVIGMSLECCWKCCCKCRWNVIGMLLECH